MAAPMNAREAVVYTFGKVGSTATAHALREAGVETHAIHSLAPHVLKRQMRSALQADTLPLHHVLLSALHRPRLRRRPPKTWFITLVREPVAVRLASFFENLPHRTDGLGPESSEQVLARTFMDEVKLDYQLGWFDREFKVQLGIDIMAHPFDRAARALVIPEERVLVMRADCPDAEKSRLLTEIIGRPVTVARQNVGAEKPYAAAYAALKGQIRFPAERLDPIYGSQHVRHFWTEAEIEGFRATWTA